MSAWYEIEGRILVVRIERENARNAIDVETALGIDEGSPPRSRGPRGLAGNQPRNRDRALRQRYAGGDFRDLKRQGLEWAGHRPRSTGGPQKLTRNNRGLRSARSVQRQLHQSSRRPSDPSR